MLKFSKYNFSTGKPFAITYAFLFVLMSYSFFAAQEINDQNFPKITITDGATITSKDLNFNAKIIDKEVQVLNGTYKLDANGVIVIISEDNTIACNNHITHQQTRSYQKKEFKIRKSATKKIIKYQKIKDFNDDYVSSTPFLPNNFFKSRYGFHECLTINLYNYNAFSAENTSELYRTKTLIEDLLHQKYKCENKLLLFFKIKSFFTRPPPYKAGLLSDFI